MRTALRGGVVNYLLKPFDQDALRDRLQRYAATHQSLAAPTVAQTDLDHLFGAAPARQASARPAGRGSAPSRRSWSRACCELRTTTCRRRSAPAAPGSPGVSARRYLEYFVEAGRAEVRLQYGAAGPPAAPLRLARPPHVGLRRSGRSRCSTAANFPLCRAPTADRTCRCHPPSIPRRCPAHRAQPTVRRPVDRRRKSRHEETSLRAHVRPSEAVARLRVPGRTAPVLRRASEDRTPRQLPPRAVVGPGRRMHPAGPAGAGVRRARG